MDTTTHTTLRAEFLREIEDYCAANDMSATAFGMLAKNDPNFVSDLRKGRDPRMSTIQKVRDILKQSSSSPSAGVSSDVSQLDSRVLAGDQGGDADSGVQGGGAA